MAFLALARAYAESPDDAELAALAREAPPGLEPLLVSGSLGIAIYPTLARTAQSIGWTNASAIISAGTPASRSSPSVVGPSAPDTIGRNIP